MQFRAQGHIVSGALEFPPNEFKIHTHADVLQKRVGGDFVSGVVASVATSNVQRAPPESHHPDYQNKKFEATTNARSELVRNARFRANQPTNPSQLP